MKAGAFGVEVVALGCPKALVDAQAILGILAGKGVSLRRKDEAPVVLVNTCGFIEDAQQESFAAIEEALGRGKKVVVAGCLGKRKEKIMSLFPGVFEVTGPEPKMAAEAVSRALGQAQSHPLPSPRLTPRHWAYLKISEGCNHACTFCIIPQFRGKLCSRPLDEILSQAKRLIEEGVKELVVVSQDTAAYGFDHQEKRGKEPPIVALCRALGEMGVWVRLHYVYPYPFVEDLVHLMKEGLILPYLDVPFQHASAKILSAMKRPASDSCHPLVQIEKWRAIFPDIALRTTLLVGFPGEGEKEFQELLHFVDQAQIDRLGAFAFSPVEGAAASTYLGQVPEEVKRRRQEVLLARQKEISAKKLAMQVGRRKKVLVDEVRGTLAIARSAADAPEVDGKVYVRPGEGLSPGQWLDVRMEGASEHDLFARRVRGSRAFS